MDVRTCRRCKKLFNYSMGPIICPACREEMEGMFQDVKKYVRENPRSDMRTVAEECNVDINQIRQWIREERLEFAEDSAVMLNCEKCGRSIRTGRFCEECKNNMARTFGRATATSAPAKEETGSQRTSNRMRFLDR